MPTGYTANVKDGISFEQFVWQCSRAMGAMIMMRGEPFDAPIPDRFEPGDYHDKSHKEALAELGRLQALTTEQVLSECKSEHTESERRKANRLAENEAQLASYEAMLAKVEAWVPPTSDHEEFKEFMVSQLKESIKFDDSRNYLKPSQMPSPDEWLTEKIAKAKSVIDYYSEAHREEVARTEARNKWLAALRDSLNA